MKQPSVDQEFRLYHRRKRLIFLHWLIPIVLLSLILGSCQRSPQPFATTATSLQPGPTLLFTSAQNSTQVAAASPTATITSIPLQVFTFTPLPAATITSAPAPAYTSTAQPPVVFAVIGDYGSGDAKEGDVAKQVESWKPEFIITVGDNNYPVGAWDFMYNAVGKFYHSYIYPYKGSGEEGSDVNRFFPSIGNHDLDTDKGKPYFDYFTLPGNERYYDFVWGPLHFFALNNVDDPDGENPSSIQAQWLKEKLSESTSAWDIVYMHYPPYSSGTHGSFDWAQWPFADWGAEVVMAGHDHDYERLQENGIPYFVNGLGGGGIYNFNQPIAGSQVRFDADWGAMRVEATDQYMKFEFITRKGDVIDTYEINK